MTGGTQDKRQKAEGADGRMRLLLACIIGAYLAYAAVYIYMSSFPVAGVRHFSLFDDMMISMRYARNLAQGSGLVWNAGAAPVEGFSNPLWVAIMACVHLLPISILHTSLIMQGIGAALLVACLIMTARVAHALSDGSRPAVIGAVLLSASYLPLNTWGLLGTEVSLLAVLLTTAVWRVVEDGRRGRTTLWPLVLLGIALLVRLDMVVSFLVMLAFLVRRSGVTWRRTLAGGLGLLVLAIVPQTALRYWYFGQPLPNTYYLKLAGYPMLLRMSRGLYTMFRFAYFSHFVVVLVPLFAALRSRRPAVTLIALLFGGQLTYSIYVGGDAWEERGGANRFVAVAMPVFFVLLSLCLLDLARSIDSCRRSARWQVSPLAWPVLLVAAVFCMNSTPGVLRPTFNGASVLRETFLPSPFCAQSGLTHATVAHWLKGVTEPGAKIAVVQAGVLPYYLPDREMIDLLGKCDRVIAHEPMHQFRAGLAHLTAFYPGHLKWDYAWSIGQLHPDVIVGLWGPDAEEQARPFLEGRYVKTVVEGRDLYLRAGSPRIRWASIDRARTLLTAIRPGMLLSDGSTRTD